MRSTKWRCRARRATLASCPGTRRCLPAFAPERCGIARGGEKHFLAVSVGFAEVLPDRVTVLSQVAERAEDLDEARAEAGMARAEEMLRRAPQQMDFERARLAPEDAPTTPGRVRRSVWHAN